MASARGGLLRGLWRSWWFKVGGPLTAIYASLQLYSFLRSEFFLGWYGLGVVSTMFLEIVPWWGVLLVFQTVLILAAISAGLKFAQEDRTNYQKIEAFIHKAINESPAIAALGISLQQANKKTQALIRLPYLEDQLNKLNQITRQTEETWNHLDMLTRTGAEEVDVLVKRDWRRSHQTTLEAMSRIERMAKESLNHQIQLRLEGGHENRAVPGEENIRPAWIDEYRALHRLCAYARPQIDPLTKLFAAEIDRTKETIRAFGPNSFS